MSDDELDNWGSDWEDTSTINNTKPDIIIYNNNLLKKNYNILDSIKILNLQKYIINEVCDILNINYNDTLILLRYFNWNKQKLIDEWLVNCDNIKLKYKLNNNVVPLPSKKNKTNSKYTCPVCSEKFKFKDTYMMSCNHRFCNDCWKSWVTAEMDKGTTAILSVCPEHKCGTVLNDEVFHKFLSSEMYQKYLQFNISSFVTNSFNLRFCPGAACELAIENKGSKTSADVECSCGTKFCFGCGSSAHRPVPCDIASNWIKKNVSDSENANWLLANTKVCPKCKVSIEKNQGCNHMSCQQCQHHFCWICKGDWKEHIKSGGAGYQCNQYNEDEKKNRDKAANDIQRYLHYFSRFDNHVKSAKIAEKQLLTTQVKMKELQAIKGDTSSYVEFLLNAVQTIINNRYVLMWTYAYGFYLENQATQKVLFETYQHQLEAFTEHLHGLIEKPLDELKEEKLRTDVINYTRVTEKYRENIILAIETNFSFSE